MLDTVLAAGTINESLIEYWDEIVVSREASREVSMISAMSKRFLVARGCCSKHLQALNSISWDIRRVANMNVDTAIRKRG